MTFEDLFKEYSIEYRHYGEHHHAVRGWIQTDCPDCSPQSGSFRLGWNVTRRYANCWVCGPKRTGDTLAALLNVEPRVAARYAKLLRSEDDRHPEVRAMDARGTLSLPAGLGPLRETHRMYLRKRHFNPSKLVREWGLEGFGLAGRYSWRIFIPIYNKKGEMVSWTTRSLVAKDKSKYMAAPAGMEKVSHKHLLYGEHKVQGHAVVVVEGPPDVWAIGPGAVALTGLNVSENQVYKIAQYPIRVVCLDNEDAAQRRADALCEQLAPYPGQTVRVRLECAKDPGECLVSAAGRAELDELRSTFLSGSDRIAANRD